MSDRNVCTQYKDPITRERRTVVLCDAHTRDAVHRFHLLGIGCSSTDAGALHDCDACRNERGGQRRLLDPTEGEDDE